MCTKSETLFNIYDKISCRLLAILNVIGNGILILYWVQLWYNLHMSGGGVYVNLYHQFPISVTVWLTVVIVCTSLSYAVSLVLLVFQIFNRCYGSIIVYYMIGTSAMALAVLITVVQLACRHGEDGDRFFAEPTVIRTVWGLFLFGVNVVLLVFLYHKLPRDISSSEILVAKPPEIPLHEIAIMLPSAPPLHLLEEDFDR